MKFKIFTKISQFFGEGVTPYQRSEKEADSVNNTPNTEEFERCVMCGALTCIPVSMPIDWRNNYVIGCGQLCNECVAAQQKIVERHKSGTSVRRFAANSETDS